MTIYHDNYTAVVAALPVAVFSLGRGRRIYTDTQNGMTSVPIAWRQSTLSATTSNVVIPAPYGYQKLLVNGTFTFTNAADVDISATIIANANSGAAIRAPLFVRNARNFNLASNLAYQIRRSVLVGATDRQIVFDFEVPIPSNTEVFTLVLNYPAITSADSFNVSAYGK